MILRRICLSLLTALAVCLPAIAHPGGITTPDPNLPPEDVYLSPSDVHAMYGGAALAIVLTKPQHLPFRDLPPEYLQPGGHEHHDFASTLEGQAQCLGVNCAMLGVPDGGMFPVYMEGRVQTVALGKGPTDTTGTFPTEMLAMNLSGVGPTPPFIKIRESPTLPSLGSTSITDVGGGLYHIDSFFDVFTELSLDGGASWMPNTAPNPYGPTGSTRVVMGIPEPASIALLVLGMLGFAGPLRRRR